MRPRGQRRGGAGWGGGRSSPITAATVSLPPSLLRCPHLRLSASDLEPLLTTVFVFAFSILNDERFHPSVRYLKYASERIVSFVPPDGGFKLMSYKINSQAGRSVQKTIIPFYVKPQITYTKESGRISIMAGIKGENGKIPEQVGASPHHERPRGPRQQHANTPSLSLCFVRRDQVSIKIPLPSTTTTCDISSTVGSVEVSL